MGEGQEVIAREKIKNGFLTGSWVVLQNCHLGLGFMAELEILLLKTQDVDDVSSFYFMLLYFVFLFYFYLAIKASNCTIYFFICII